LKGGKGVLAELFGRAAVADAFEVESGIGHPAIFTASPVRRKALPS
jgi:hypothetical protein